MMIVVKPGELIPVDGIVTSGSSSISEADLTGEPIPVRKTPGMLVLSGSVNLDGVLEVRASKRSTETTDFGDADCYYVWHRPGCA